MRELKMKTTGWGVALVIAVAGLCVSACSKGGNSSTGSGEKAVTADLAAGRKIFEERCVACHGKGGHGDGPGAASLNPKPRNYTDKKWQKSVTDAELRKVILGGGAAVGKNPLMPPNPDLKKKPEVVEGLVKIIRQFGS